MPEKTAEKKNRFMPSTLERFSFGLMLVLVLLSFSMANLQSLLWIESDFLVSSILPSVIVDLTNEERSARTFGTLRRSGVLDEAAKKKAEHMAEHGYFAHYSPEGISPWYWFDEVSYDYLHAGENLAVHFTDSDDVVEAWMHSPAHRDNILNGNFTEIGVGTAKGEYKGYPTVFIVQLFGTPRAVLAESEGAVTLESALESAREPEVKAEVAQASIETVPEEALSPAETSTETASEPQKQDSVAKESVVVTSDLITASRPGTPLVIEEETEDPNPELGFLGRMATQPSLWLQVVYGALALVVVLALIVSIVMELRRNHPVQIAYACALLVLMGVLLKMHLVLTTGATII